MFIVLEGIDGSGTTTQAKLLVDYFRKREEPALGTHEPSGRDFGQLIREIFTRQDDKPLPPWEAMALAFAADRIDHVRNVVEPALASGSTVISDRYYYSSVGYQALSAADIRNGYEVMPWIKSLNRYACVPDKVFVLDVPLEEASRRDQATRDKFSSQDRLQQELIYYYKNLAQFFCEEREHIVQIDGTGTVEEVFYRIIENFSA